MCVLSMVYDHYQPKFPKFTDITPTVQSPATTTVTLMQPLGAKELEELRQLIKEFREAVAAAKKVDELTSQPDCEDPAKAKLEERVARLEKKLAALGEP